MRALAHVTGGGLTENLPRVLPAGTNARIDRASWALPAVFDWIRGGAGDGADGGRTGPRVADEELLRTFNCGIGMALVVPEAAADATVAALAGLDERAHVIGTIVAADDPAAAARVEYVGDWPAARHGRGS